MKVFLRETGTVFKRQTSFQTGMKLHQKDLAKRKPGINDLTGLLLWGLSLKLWPLNIFPLLLQISLLRTDLTRRRAIRKPKS
jgi:hypothetical protein